MFKKQRSSGVSSSERWPWVTLILVAWYVTLAAAHYFNQRLMWNDEACVFESIQYFEPRQMFTTPLRALQVFPRVYLFLIQQFSGLFNFHLLSLRFFSFVAMLTAFWLWLKLARRSKADSPTGRIFSPGGVGAAGLLRAELKPLFDGRAAGAIFVTFLYHEGPARETRVSRFVSRHCPRWLFCPAFYSGSSFCITWPSPR